MTASSREEHIRRLAGLFDSPQLEPVQEAMRAENGDCWDCREEAQLEYLVLGGHRKVIIKCVKLVTDGNGRALSVMRSLPFRCPNWVKAKKLTVIDGGDT